MWMTPLQRHTSHQVTKMNQVTKMTLVTRPEVTDLVNSCTSHVDSDIPRLMVSRTFGVEGEARCRVLEVGV